VAKLLLKVFTASINKILYRPKSNNSNPVAEAVNFLVKRQHRYSAKTKLAGLYENKMKKGL